MKFSDVKIGQLFRYNEYLLEKIKPVFKTWNAISLDGYYSCCINDDETVYLFRDDEETREYISI